MGTCARCGNFICSACATQKGDQTLCPTCAGLVDAGREPTPWEQREELGWRSGWWRTAKKVLIEPEKFWKTVRPHAPWQEALWFGWLVVVAAAAIAIPFELLQAGQMKELIETFGKDLPKDVRTLLWSWGGPGAAIGIQVVSTALYPVWLLINAAIVHVFAMLAGASKNGFGATVRALAYASVPNVFAGIPYVGGLCGLYVIVLEVWALYKIQETTLARALIAVLAPLVLLCCCIVGVGIAAVAMVARGN
ncbi:MAG TPA: hypothetical protein VH208_07265 [Myxococcaceae bacterium]|nr:hypothetical protein [Myxococcaceae bacterium]